MHILLIKPPNRGFLHQQERHFPIGLAYLSAVLQKAGHQVTVFDSLGYPEDNHVVQEYLGEIEREKIRRHPRWAHLVHWGANWSRIEGAIRKAAPDVVGISCMFSCYYLSAERVAEIVKGIFPETPIMMGGSHATSMPDKVLAHSAVDAIAMGEAEDTIVPLAEALFKRAPLNGLEGVGYRCGSWCSCPEPGSNGNHLSPKSWWRQDLDDLPLPFVDGVEWNRYGGTTTLITSRGCPFACTFCSVHATVGKKFRARDARLVVDEIEWYVKNHGVHSFNIEDDNFTFDVDRVKSICREIIKRQLKIQLRLPNGITSLQFSEELAQLMVAAGFKHLFIGLETTDQAILKDIAKGFTSLEKVEDAADKLRRFGIHPVGSLIVGLPGQDIHSVAADAVKLQQRNILASVNAFYPVPGAPDYQRALAAGLIAPETDPALLEGPAFNAAFKMTGPEVYWTWIAVTVINYVSRMIFQGREMIRNGKHPNHRAIVSSLMATLNFWHETKMHRRLPPLAIREIVDLGLRLPSNWWSLKAGMKFVLPKSSCFCGRHRVAQQQSGIRVCSMIADLMSMAVGLTSETAVSFQETECSLQGLSGCTFEAKSEPLPDEAVTVAKAFIQLIDGLIEPAKLVVQAPRPENAARA